MKLSINRNLLIKAINLVVKAADKRHRFEILANIKLQLSEQYLILTASDLEVELTTKVPLQVGCCIQEGSTTLPAETFFNICKSLSDEKVVIDLPEGSTRCVITSGKGRYTLSALPAMDFPSIGHTERKKVVKISQDNLESLIHHTKFAMATQDVRHYLTGMMLEINADKLTAVATDGHRLAIAHRFLSESYEDSQVIIPGKAISELERLLQGLARTHDEHHVVELGFDDDFLQVKLVLSDGEQSQMMPDLDVELTARLIEGKFPDYRRVLPRDNDKVASFDKEQAVDVLRRISVLNSKDNPGVVLQFEESSSVKVGAKTKTDAAEENLAVNFSGSPLEISFNEGYLRAVLNVLEGEIKLEMSQASTPALIYQVGDDLHRYVVMPMRMA